MIMLNYKTIILLIVLYLIFNSRKCNCENMMPLSEIVKTKNPKNLEITKLDICNPDMLPKYKKNSNHIINDGQMVYQKIVRTLPNRILVDGNRYFLSQIEWHKSVFLWNNQEIGLDLHLVHTSANSYHTMRIIFPLNLIDGNRTYFNDISFDKNIKNITTLNSLLVDQSYIPSYSCCSPNEGRVVTFNLAPIANLIADQDVFYKYIPSKQSVWFITKPQNFNKAIGLTIRERLE